MNGFSSFAGDGRRHAAVVKQVLGPVVEVVEVEVGPGVAEADLELELFGDGKGPIGEEGDLAVVGAGVIDVIVAIGKQVLAPGGDHVLAPQQLGKRGQFRVVDLLGAALGAVGIEQAGHPLQTGGGVGGLEAELLGEVLLAVGDQVARQVAGQARQVEPGGGQQPGRILAVCWRRRCRWRLNCGSDG